MAEDAHFHTVEQLVEQYIEATRADDVGAIGRLRDELFGRASVETLRKLKRSEHPGVAIASAWESIRRTLTMQIPGDEIPEKINRRRLSWFLGFLEAKANVEPPKWWATRFASLRYRSQREVGPWLRDVSPPLGYRAIEAAEIFVPEKLYNVRRTKEGGLVFGIDGQVCHMVVQLFVCKTFLGWGRG